MSSTTTSTIRNANTNSNLNNTNINTANINYVLAITYLLIYLFIDLYYLFLHLYIDVDISLLISISYVFLIVGIVIIIYINNFDISCNNNSNYVILQSIGYVFFVLSLISSSSYNLNNNYIFIGLASLIGIIGCVSLILLRLSLNYKDVENKEETINNRIGCNINILLSIILSTISFCLYTLSDVLHYKTWNINYMFILSGLIGFILSSYTIHVIIGMNIYSNYKLLMPFRNTPSFIATQAIGWMLLTILILCSLFVLNVGLPNFHIPMPMMQVGLIGLFSTIFLLISIRCFDNNDANAKSSIPFGWNSIMHGQTMFSLILSFTATIAFVIIDLTRSVYTDNFIGQIGLAFGILAAITSFISPLIMHQSGKYIHPGFHSWMPFEGGSQFVMLQAIGWTGYGLSLLLTWIYLGNYAINLELIGVSIVSFGSLVSNLLIMLSLTCFKSSDIKASIDNHSTLLLPFFKIILTGEMIVSWVFSICSFLFYSSVDFNISLLDIVKDKVIDFPALLSIIPLIDSTILLFPTIRAQLFFYGIICQLVTLWILHVVAGPSIYKSAYNIYQPFQGGILFVIIQALGWTLNAITILFHVLLSINSIEFLDIRGIATFSAIIAFLAMFLIYVSLIFFNPTSIIEINVNVSISNFVGSDEDIEYISSCSEGLNQLMTLAKEIKLPISTQSLLRQITNQVNNKINEVTFTDSLDSKTVDPTYRWKSETLLPFVLTICTLFIWFVIDFSRYLHLQPHDVIKLNSDLGFWDQIYALDGYLRVARAMANFAFLGGWIILILVHVIAGPRLHESYRLYQPFVGGWKFCLIQAIGIMLCSISILLTWILLKFGIQNIHFSGLLSSFGIFQAVGNVCFIYSLNLFEEKERLHHLIPSKPSFFLKKMKLHRSILYSADTNTTDGDLALSVILSLCAVLLFGLVDYVKHEHPSIPSLPIITGASIAMLGAVALAYWATNKNKSLMDRSTAPDNDTVVDEGLLNWLQMTGLTISALSTVFIMYAIHSQLNDRLQPLTTFLSAHGLAGVSGIMAEILLVIVALSSKTVLTESRKRSFSVISMSFYYEAFRDVRAVLLMTSLYSMHLIMYGTLIGLMFIYRSPGAISMYIYCTFRVLFNRFYIFILNSVYAVLLAHAIWTQDYDFTIWLTITLLYGITYFSNASKTGSRRWKWFQNLGIWEDCTRYFDFKVLSSSKLDAKKTYIFAYHPHGILPFGMVWAFLTKAFKNKFPGIEPYTCGATILLNVPIARDIGMWAGGRDVSRDSITHALSHNQSIALIPGGQAEMRESRPVKKMGNSIYIVTRHSGFIRMALTHGADLVPVFAFGETEIFENVYLPSLQQWFLKNIGFLFPVWVYGRWYLNIPNNYPLRMAVGEPISVSKISEPTQEDVDILHKKYFESLMECFEKHKLEAGFGECTLHFASKKEI